MPQFDFGFWPGQIFWLLVTFGVLYAVLSVVLLPQVRGTINAREDRIAGDLKEARRLRDAADEDAKAAEAGLAEARGRAQRLAAEARAKAASEAALGQSKLEGELSQRLGRAEARIRAARDEAMGHVEAIAGDTARSMVDKLVGAAASEG